VLKEFVYRLRGELDISENQDRIDLVAGDIEKYLVVLLHDKPVARLAEYRTLFGNVDISQVE
jgi:hypothetical protein